MSRFIIRRAKAEDGAALGSDGGAAVRREPPRRVARRTAIIPKANRHAIELLPAMNVNGPTTSDAADCAGNDMPHTNAATSSASAPVNLAPLIDRSTSRRTPSSASHPAPAWSIRPHPDKRLRRRIP